MDLRFQLVTGADELFTGYYDHYNIYNYEIRYDQKLLNDAIKNWNTHFAGIVRNPYLKDPYLYHKNKQERRHIFLHNDIFRKFLCIDFNEEFKKTKYADSFLKNRMMNEMFNEVVPVILEEDDRNSMAYSIENRSPFLDKRLFEIAMSIPTKYYIKNGFMKSVLRDSMEESSQTILQKRGKSALMLKSTN